MELNKLYKNKNNTDVAFYPTYILEGDVGLYLDGNWVNIVYDQPKLLDKDSIYIKKNDIPNWKEYERE